MSKKPNDISETFFIRGLITALRANGIVKFISTNYDYGVDAGLEAAVKKLEESGMKIVGEPIKHIVDMELFASIGVRYGLLEGAETVYVRITLPSKEAAEDYFRHCLSFDYDLDIFKEIAEEFRTAHNKHMRQYDWVG